jgi:transposase-like protein
LCRIFTNKNNYLTNVKNLLFMIAVFINIFSWIIKLWLDGDEDLEQNLLTKDSQASIFSCPKCGSCHTIKNGSTHNGKPKRKGKNCGQPLVINPSHKTVSNETQKLINLLLLERISLRGIARVTGVSWSCLQNYLNNKFNQFPRQV